MSISAEEILAEIGPVQEVLDAHDGVVTVLDTSDGNIMLSLDGGCTGCSSTPMTAMQIYYSLKKLEAVNDVIFVNGELPEYMRTFINQKMEKESAESTDNGPGEIVRLFLFDGPSNAVWIRSERNVLDLDVHACCDCQDNADDGKWTWEVVRPP